MTLTTANQGMTLVVAVAYGGRWDLANACQALARRCLSGALSVDELDENSVSDHMALAGLPDPDLMIRTGGEQRISNFLLWNLAYTELYFTDALWPEFNETHLDAAIEHFARRQRRFGLTPDQVEVR